MMETAEKKKNQVVHTWNRDNSIFVRYDTPDGKRQTKEFEIDWFFAILRVDEEKATTLLNEIGYRYRMTHDPQFPDYTKIHLNNPPRGSDLPDKYSVVLFLDENKIQTFEGDLPNDKRWYVDKQIEVAGDYRKLYFDIETDDSIRKIEIGRDRILSWAAVDDKGKVYFEVLADMTDAAEKELLLKFLKLIKRYDILLGWNSKGFDVPYLKARMKKFGLDRTKDYVWKQVANFDLLKRFRHIFRFDSSLRSFSLEFISRHFLGKGKIPHTEGIKELWDNNRELLKEYNIEDSLLVKELDEKLGVSNMMILQSQWCGVPPSQFGLYAIIDSFIMKTAHKVGKFCKTSIRAIKEKDYSADRGKENPDEATDEGAKYTGAAVIDPKIGFYEKVYTFDFKSLYPSMMRTSNIGFDSIEYFDDGKNFVNPGTAAINRKSGKLIPTYFKREPSVINIAITELLQKRKEYKKLKLKMIEEGTNKGPQWESVVSDEIIVKELANSTYGIMGLEYGRYFSVDVAESITLFGQWNINFAQKFFEERGYLVIYGDTDSVFVAAGKELDQELELKLFHDALERELRMTFRIDTSYIELEPDKIFDTLILLAKKNYVGHVTNIEGKKTDDIYARGLDFVKKNTFSFAAQKQRELANLMLLDKADKEKVREFLVATKEEYYQREFSPKELSIVQRVGKPAREYKVAPLHARLALQIEEETGVNMLRNEVEYVITSSHKGMDGVILDKYDGKNFDRDYYWTNKTVPVLDRLTKVVFPDVVDFYTVSRSLFDHE